MIITIKGADFSLANIGTLGSFLVRYMGNVIENISTVEKNAEGTAAKAELVSTITMRTGYKYESLSITVNGVDVTGYNVVNNEDGTITLTIPAELITGTVVVSVMTTNDQGEDEEGTIELYSFDISTTPKVAKVTLSADGYTQSGNSIQVPFGTEVAWTVESLGYATQSGNETIIKDGSQNIVLANEVEGQCILSVIAPEGSTIDFTPSGSTKIAQDANSIVLTDNKGRVYYGAKKDGYEPAGDVVHLKNNMEIELTLTPCPIVEVDRVLEADVDYKIINGYFVTSSGAWNGYYTNFRFIQVPVTPGQRYKITSRTGQNAWPVYFTSNIHDLDTLDLSEHPAASTLTAYKYSVVGYKKYAGPPTEGTWVVTVPENAVAMLVCNSVEAGGTKNFAIELLK